MVIKVFSNKAVRLYILNNLSTLKKLTHDWGKLWKQKGSDSTAQVHSQVLCTTIFPGNFKGKKAECGDILLKTLCAFCEHNSLKHKDNWECFTGTTEDFLFQTNYLRNHYRKSQDVHMSLITHLKYCASSPFHSGWASVSTCAFTLVSTHTS